MSSLPSLPISFAASTGAKTFDAITWSSPPICKLVAVGHGGVQAIRHLGSSADGTTQTRSRGDQRPDSLMLSRRSVGTFEARAGGEFKSSSQFRDLCCYLPHGIDADLEFPSQSQAIILHFPAGFLKRHLDPSSQVPLDPAPAFRDPALANVMAMIEQELAGPGFGTDLMLEGLYQCVASSLARRKARPAHEAADRVYMSPARLRDVIDYVEAHLADKISIQDMADVAAISMFHFARVFKKSMNQTPYQYVRFRRLNRAQMMMQSDATLVEIGLSCGFANQAHFTSAFMKETGMPPGRYRRLLLGDP